MAAWLWHDQPMQVPFHWVDVFAERALTGNPLAVVPDADALSEPMMRAIAREFNQSETTFIWRPTDPRADVRLRSFTPGGVEVLGAGHNALGAWLLLAALDRLPAGDTFTQQIGDDLLEVRIRTTADGRAEVSMDQSPADFFGRVKDATALAASLGLDEPALSTETVPEVASTGAAHLLVRAVSAAAVDAAVPHPAALK